MVKQNKVKNALKLQKLKAHKKANAQSAAEKKDS